MARERTPTVDGPPCQWRNPANVLFLLLFMGGDIVQRALAQLTGYSILARSASRPRPSLEFTIAPVAFSFCWFTFGFTRFMSGVCMQQLLPSVRRSALVMNCANLVSRDNQSWVLERLLRHQELQHRMNKTDALMLISIFELGPFSEGEKPHLVCDVVWRTGWITIAVQMGIAIAPLVLYGNWAVVLIFLVGTVLALLTSALPQWRREKWAGSMLERGSACILTRSSGHRNVMVFIGGPGSYNLETMATMQPQVCPETPLVIWILASLWVLLLLCTSRMKEDLWFLTSICGLGMLQNVYAAGVTRSPETIGLKIKPFTQNPTIVAKRNDKMVRSPTHEALKELEKWVPTAGLAAAKMFCIDVSDFGDRRPE